MINIKTADVCSEEYKLFESWLLKEWGEIDQLPKCNEMIIIPSPILAFYDEKMVGGLVFIKYKNPKNENDAIWINAVYIDANYRGRGIASKLINKSVEVVKHYGHSELFAYTDKKDLYLKSGWHLVSEDDDNSIMKFFIE